MKFTARRLSKELQEKFYDLLVTWTVVDDEFKADPINQELISRDPNCLHRQEMSGHADEYERREELLSDALSQMCKLDTVDIEKVYKILVSAKRAEMNSKAAQSGVDRRRTFFSTRDKLRKSYLQAAIDLRTFLQLTNYPTTVLDPTSGERTKRQTLLTRLLGETLLEVARDPMLNLEPDPDLPLRAAKAGRRAEPWLTKARKDFAKTGLPTDLADFLLISVGLTPDRLGDYS